MKKLLLGMTAAAFSAVAAFAADVKPAVIYDLGGKADLKIEAKYYTGIKTSKLETQSFFAISTGLVFFIY